jgi:hypothetical protein
MGYTGVGRQSSVGALHTTAPNIHPMPAVIAMANPPQNVTRIAPIITPAPPARAANPPRRASNASEDTDTRGINPCAGDIAVTKRGINAPTAKLAAEDNAA